MAYLESRLRNREKVEWSGDGFGIGIDMKPWSRLFVRFKIAIPRFFSMIFLHYEPETW
jgi:hypothetical protein